MPPISTATPTHQPQSPSTSNTTPSETQPLQTKKSKFGRLGGLLSRAGTKHARGSAPTNQISASHRNTMRTTAQLGQIKKVRFDPNDTFLQSNRSAFRTLGTIKANVDQGKPLSQTERGQIVTIFSSLAEQYFEAKRSTSDNSPTPLVIGTLLAMLSNEPEFTAVMQTKETISALIDQHGAPALEQLSDELDALMGLGSIIKQHLCSHSKHDTDTILHELTQAKSSAATNDLNTLAALTNKQELRQIYQQQDKTPNETKAVVDNAIGNIAQQQASHKHLTKQDTSSVKTDFADEPHPKASSASAASAVKTFFKKSHHELLALLKSATEQRPQQVEAIGDVLDQLTLYHIEQKPLSQCHEAERLHPITHGLVKWILSKPTFQDTLHHTPQAAAYCNVTQEDARLFKDFTTLQQCLERGVPVDHFECLTTEDSAQLINYLYKQNLLIIFSELLNPQPSNSDDQWQQLKAANIDTKPNREATNAFTSPLAQAAFQTDLSPELQTHLKSLKYGSLGTIEAKRLQGSDQKEQRFRDYLPTGEQVLFGPSPNNADEVYALISLGIERRDGCMQYVSPQRIAKPNQFKTPSIVGYLLDNKAQLLKDNAFASAIEHSNLTLKNIEEVSYADHEHETRAAVVTLEDADGVEIKVPFTELGLPYQRGSLDEQGLAKALTLEAQHLQLADNGDPYGRHEHHPPIIVSRGGNNRCVQHTIAGEQFRWLKNLRQCLTYATNQLARSMARFNTLTGKRKINKESGWQKYAENTQLVNETLLAHAQKRPALLLSQLRNQSDKQAMGTKHAYQTVIAACDARLNSEQAQLATATRAIAQRHADTPENLQKQQDRQARARHQMGL